MRFWARVLVLVCAACLASAAFAEERLVMFAAASLKNAIDAAAAKYHADGGAEVAVSYGSSLALARQIIAGAPADVYASADEASMDEAVKAGAIRPGTRLDLLVNALVLIAPKTAPFDELALDKDGLGMALDSTRLATGDTSTVPVGKYAKAALTKLGIWDIVEPHLALTSDVRGALNFVARGEAGLGIVYATDAAAEPKVKIVAVFPEDTHPPIRYPFAITAASTNTETQKFFDFLKSAQARPFFAAQGFGAP
jgi:molybdate transport system substrate-binding protein